MYIYIFHKTITFLKTIANLPVEILKSQLYSHFI